VPIVSDPCRVGRDVASEVVVEDPRIAALHARVRYQLGEYLLTGEGDAAVFVNGKRAPVMPLRSGDLVTLTSPGDPRPVCLRFVSRMEGSFLPPGASLAAAWLGHPAFAGAGAGPARFEGSETLSGGDSVRSRRAVDPESGLPVLVRTPGPVRSAEEAEAWLRLLEALAGAPHPELPFVLDGGLAPGAEGAERWVALRWEEGTVLEERLREGPLAPRDALAALLAAARAVAHLHRRGLAHRAVSPARLLCRAERGALLLGTTEASFGAAPAERAEDVLALAEVGRALFPGGAPEPVENALLQALEEDAARRPDAAAFAHALAFAQASLVAEGAA
jgi:hypothetical protein